jgi:hypothetical protein|tara:strand:+ start:2173 stop:2781 length:609 start_codon:yes stop_codon:yes gene_type:complete
MKPYTVYWVLFSFMILSCKSTYNSDSGNDYIDKRDMNLFQSRLQRQLRKTNCFIKNDDLEYFNIFLFSWDCDGDISFLKDPDFLKNMKPYKQRINGKKQVMGSTLVYTDSFNKTAYFDGYRFSCSQDSITPVWYLDIILLEKVKELELKNVFQLGNYWTHIYFGVTELEDVIVLDMSTGEPKVKDLEVYLNEPSLFKNSRKK